MYGCIFDMDGVLADTEGLSVAATNAMFRELYGVEPAPEDYEPFVGKGAVAYVEGAAGRVGVEIDTPKAVQRRTEIFVEMLDAAQDISFPGVHPLIETLAQQEGWKLAIATSSPRAKAEATLKAANIDLEQFTVFVNGDMVTHKKPHPEIFLTAAEGLGIEPAHCAGVEDAPPGVEALLAADVASVAVTNSFPRSALSRANLVVDTLEELTVQRLRGLVDGHA